MNIMYLSYPTYGVAKMVFRAPRRNRPNLVCESLEYRQLLSADSAIASATQLTAQPSLDVVPMVSTGPTGYSPQQIQAAYGVNQIRFSGGTVKGNGAGETITIVDAYNDPNIVSDLAKFDSQYGLTAPPSFKVDNLGATTTNAGWALETSLDVEWAHAIAPDAKIVLVEAASSDLNSLFSAVSYAGKSTGASVVSMSWGTQEFWGEQRYDSLFTTPGVTYVASSGDSGAWSGPMYPSVSPNVLSVGGTSLTLNSNGSYGSETGWSGSTGGFSGLDMNWWSYETAPSYQVNAQASVGLNYGARTTPDVSFNADPNTGVAVYDSVSYSGQSGWFEVGGTSAAAPAWAGLVAITDQGLATGGKGPLSTSQALTDLYKLPSSDFNDVTAGFNGYSATAGYDLVTGLGTPKSNEVVAGLLSASGVSSTVIATGAVTTGTVSSSSSSISSSNHHVSENLLTIITVTTQVETVVSSLPVQAVGVLETPTNNTAAAATNAQATQQSSTATTTLSASAATTTSFGQSVSQSLVTSSPGTGDDSDAIKPIDQPEPAMPPAPLLETPTDQAPVPDDAPQQQNDKGTEPPAIPPAAPAAPAEPMTDPSPVLFDAALEAIGARRSTPRSIRPNEPRVVDPVLPREDFEPASSAPSTLAGTVAVAAAGVYWFTLGQADRKQYRWIPGRI
jgi:subtilase family serine protease